MYCLHVFHFESLATQCAIIVYMCYCYIVQVHHIGDLWNSATVT